MIGDPHLGHHFVIPNRSGYVVIDYDQEVW